MVHITIGDVVDTRPLMRFQSGNARNQEKAREEPLSKAQENNGRSERERLRI